MIGIEELGKLLDRGVGAAKDLGSLGKLSSSLDTATRFGARHWKGLAMGALATGVPYKGSKALAHRIMHNSDPQNTPFVDALMEGVIGDPQADRKILGVDAHLGDIFNMGVLSEPSLFRNMRLISGMSGNYMNPINNLKYVNQTVNQEIGAGGYASYPYPNTTLPYRPSVSRNLNASGDVVLGLWNGRNA